MRIVLQVNRIFLFADASSGSGATMPPAVI